MILEKRVKLRSLMEAAQPEEERRHSSAWSPSIDDQLINGSLIDVSRRAAELMPEGGSIITLTYQGSNRVTPFYNVMGVAKAALESTVRYLANDLGPDGIRVNAISPGPMKTLAGAAIGGARKTFRQTEANAPLRSNATLEAVGGTAVYLCSGQGACTTGEIIRVDGGYHVLGMPQPENL